MSDHNAEIHLLDEYTGEDKGKVNVLTPSSSVQYTNSNPLLKDFGSLKKGETFDNTNLDDILNNLLYPHIPAAIKTISSNTGDSFIVNGADILKEINTKISNTRMNITVESGSESEIDIILQIVFKDKSYKHKIHQHYTTTPDNLFIGVFDLSGITINESATITVTIKDTFSSIDYHLNNIKFIEPAYSGLISDSIFDDNMELTDRENVRSCLMGMIDKVDANPNITKYLVEDKTINQMIRSSINYANREKLHPFVLIPSSWEGKPYFTDTNGNNITALYAYMGSVKLNNVPVCEAINYEVYVSRNVYDNDDFILKGITYSISTDVTSITDDRSGNQSPVLSGYDVLQSVPIDSRFVCNKYSDLLTMQYPYEGLITYVKEIKTVFIYEDGNWKPRFNHLHIIENDNVLTEDLGGWDDVAINTITGTVHKKSYNNKWEHWGQLGTGSVARSTTTQSLRFRQEFSISASYTNDSDYIDLVVYNGSTWYCKISCTGITPEEGSKYWGYFAKGSTE